jgi:hypothetical protein
MQGATYWTNDHPAFRPPRDGRKRPAGVECAATEVSNECQ